MAFVKTSNVYAVILAGGQSSRLFPFNKVISDLTGSGHSLIQQAYGRLRRLPRKQIYVLTVREMVGPIRKQLRLPTDHFFVDPVRRGTWPALLWAMAHLRRENPQAIMAVVTGDHVIPNSAEFQKAFSEAVQTAVQRSAFVMIPVKPSNDPNEWVGFGTLQKEKSGGKASLIQSFEEKPSLERAGHMIEAGDWLWNAGMFFFKISVAEEVLNVYQSAMSKIYRDIGRALAQKKTKLAETIFDAFPEKIGHPIIPKRLVDNTIDYAVMMPLVHQPHPAASAWAARTALTDWTDLGQWTALRQVVKSDRSENVRIGRIQCDPSTAHCILVADKGCAIQVEGLRNFVVAFSKGAALVLPEKEIPQIKEWVRRAKEGGEKIVSFGIPKECIQLRGRRLVVRVERGFIR
jgi:mannose-1-phosphate guanylyltransferase